MIRSLKKLTKEEQPVQISMILQERLPYFVQGPCELQCDVWVEKAIDHYHLTVLAKGRVTVICQRCLQPFDYDYDYKSDLALCRNDSIAEKMMASSDCMVQADDALDLQAIVTDDLHLFCPEKHEDQLECDGVVSQYL
ncbi:MAG: DUF177 domain-containing protein [Gammaproteobacteria bacterium]|nr:DUF177 domain-containing protein [Gammaproteobacteria bacterium]